MRPVNAPGRWAVFFDLEGTLIVRATSLEQVIETVLFAHDRVRSTNVVREATEKALRDATSSDRRALYLEVFRELALEEDAERLSAAVFEACQRVDPPVLAPGAVAALSLLHGAGAVLGVITNADGAVRELLAQLGIGRYLEVVMTPSRGGATKPDRRIFEAALVEAGVDASHAWHVGDDPVGDIQGATRAGLKAVLIRGAPVDGALSATRVDEAAALILRREAEKAR
jgi:HAD superfamily hydrolase (TIGR01509 family)